MADQLRQVLRIVAKLFAAIFFKKAETPSIVPPAQPIPPVPPPPVYKPPVPPAPSAPVAAIVRRTRPFLMRDSTNGFDIPLGTEIVAGYVDGLYAWSAAMWRHHIASWQIGITVDPRHNVGSILDVETGDATPAQAVDWVLMRRAAGHKPWVYMSASVWPQVRTAFRNRGIAEPLYWVARWGPDHTIPPGAIALQYANPTITGRHYDESIVFPGWTGDMR